MPLNSIKVCSDCTVLAAPLIINFSPTQAQWSVLKAGDCEPQLKSRLHRNLGKLAAAKNSLSEARRHFAEDVSGSIVYSILIIVYWLCADLSVKCGVQSGCNTDIWWLFSHGASVSKREENRHSHFTSQPGVSQAIDSMFYNFYRC